MRVTRISKNAKKIALYAFLTTVMFSLYWYITNSEQILRFKFTRRQSYEFETLDGEVLSEIQENIANSKNQMITDYAVLSDPYYTVQPEKFRPITRKELKTCVKGNITSKEYSSDPKDKIVSTIYCPVYGLDYMFKNQLERGVNHLRTFGMILRLLQKVPKAAYIDIGTNIGLMALPVASAIGNDRPIIAVEANPENVHSLLTALKANGYPANKWAVINRAMTDKVDEDIEFTVMKNSTNGAAKDLIRDKYKHFDGQSFTVKTATIDSHVLPVAAAMNITAAIMKIDIEGAECYALPKGKELFKQIHIPYIIMEYSINYGYARFECLERLFSEMRKEFYYPFAITSTGLMDLLDTKNYRYWTDVDVIWKKIL